MPCPTCGQETAPPRVFKMEVQEADLLMQEARLREQPHEETPITPMAWQRHEMPVKRCLEEVEVLPVKRRFEEVLQPAKRRFEEVEALPVERRFEKLKVLPAERRFEKVEVLPAERRFRWCCRRSAAFSSRPRRRGQGWSVPANLFVWRQGTRSQACAVFGRLKRLLGFGHMRAAAAVRRTSNVFHKTNFCGHFSPWLTTPPRTSRPLRKCQLTKRATATSPGISSLACHLTSTSSMDC